MKLTKKNIEAFTYQGPAPRRDARWDDEISGLGIRIYPSGKKTFILSYRMNNRKRQLTLGQQFSFWKKHKENCHFIYFFHSRMSY